MGTYDSEILSAYNDIKAAGTTITIQKKDTGTYNARLGIKIYSTGDLTAAINDVVVTFDVQNQTTAFYSSGTFWIDYERFTYTSIAGDVVSGVTRGTGGTEAASHLINAPVYLEASAQSYSTYGMFTVSKEYNPSLSALIYGGDREGTLVQSGDRTMLVPAYGLTIVPQEDDLVIVGSDTYTIKIKGVLAPSNDPILYTLMLRG